jgi:LAO/AO transport system kinase
MTSVKRILKGDRLELARLLTKVENEDPSGFEALTALYSHTGHAHRIGITGAPGTGKSSLVNRLVLHLRHSGWSKPAKTKELKIAIVAVDPSSPFSGGAFLGDRIRMRDIFGDPGIFIRSMASRGALGGLARATADMVDVLDAAGFDAVLIETVGAGQAEVDIAKMAHTVVVIDAPGLGDDVQAIKAGILEIADILVVNKADLPGAENTMRSLQLVLELAGNTVRTPPISGNDPEERAESDQRWSPPVLMTVATSGEGGADLARAIYNHREYLQQSGEFAERERSRVRAEMMGLLRERLVDRFLASKPEVDLEAAVDTVLERKLAPRQAIIDMVEGRKQ